MEIRFEKHEDGFTDGTRNEKMKSSIGIFSLFLHKRCQYVSDTFVRL